MKMRRWSIEERSAGIFVLALLFCSLFCFALAMAIGKNEPEESAPEQVQDKNILPMQELPRVSPADAAYFLAATQDAGLAYQNRLTFFGESTTAHLKSRGVLPASQVLADESGTKRLSARLPFESVRDPESGKSTCFLEVIEKKKPAILVLSFGLNGLLNYAKDTGLFKQDYNTLLDSIQSASPDTKIILQTVYPVAKECDRFDDPTDTNRKIGMLNAALPEIASNYENVLCVDTASVLKDLDGSLDPAFDQGDGYHLTASAYKRILQYLRTHAWEEEL
ncbi:MAG: hypothetical protein IJR88_03680 [Clostridia bacterium]|nr:hypothetical protein [Clostridia bacterium]